MSKPRIYGMQSGYIPNAKADMRYKKHIYQRGRESTEMAGERARNRTDKRLIMNKGNCHETS